MFSFDFIAAGSRCAIRRRCEASCLELRCASHQPSSGSGECEAGFVSRGGGF
jgi:hypothetical protein